MSYDACKVMISHPPSKVKKFIVLIPIYPFRIVGDDDGGNLFTPDEFEEYKKKVLPLRIANRLFVSWTAPNGMDCKLVGPETMCFCNHRYLYYLFQDLYIQNTQVLEQKDIASPTRFSHLIQPHNVIESITTNPTTLSLPFPPKKIHLIYLNHEFLDNRQLNKCMHYFI